MPGISIKALNSIERANVIKENEEMAQKDSLYITLTAKESISDGMPSVSVQIPGIEAIQVSRHGDNSSIISSQF